MSRSASALSARTSPRGALRSFLALALALSSLAVAQGTGWDWAGDQGQFGSAAAACEDMIGSGGAYGFGAIKDPTDAEARKKGFKACFAKLHKKDDGDKSEAELVYQGIVYPVASEEAAPEGSAADGGTASSKSGARACKATADFSWFPTPAKSPLATVAAGLVPDARDGKCDLATMTAAAGLFQASKGKLRADRYKKKEYPAGEHYFLKHEALIIDPTIFQFFATEGAFPGLVFVGTEAELRTTLDRLFEQCGPNPSTTDAKSGAAVFTGEFEGATLCNAGSTLVGKPSGRADYEPAHCQK